MTRLAVFRLYFAVRRQDLGIFGAARVALREAFRPIPF
jgi:hypothetical protein